MFILLTGDSQAGSAAPGRFPSHAEADFTWWGINAPGMVPALSGGSPTPPVLVTRAARFLADFPTLVVRCGSMTAPKCPYMETGAPTGRDPAKGPSLPGAGVTWDSGFSLGRLLAGLDDRQRAAVEALTRGLVAKVLHHPTVQIKTHAGTPTGLTATVPASAT